MSPAIGTCEVSFHNNHSANSEEALPLEVQEIPNCQLQVSRSYLRWETFVGESHPYTVPLWWSLDHQSWRDRIQIRHCKSHEVVVQFLHQELWKQMAPSKVSSCTSPHKRRVPWDSRKNQQGKHEASWAWRIALTDMQDQAAERPDTAEIEEKGSEEARRQCASTSTSWSSEYD